MRWLAAIAVVAGCATTATPANDRTLPEPVASTTLPPDTTRDPVPPEDDWVLPVEDVEVAPGDIRSGVLLSDARAMRASRLRISYDELRALYDVDLRTWGRERVVYERYLTLADEEIERMRIAAQRSWWEVNGDEVGLGLGLILGVGLSLGVGAIIAELP
jgi:hypothetical protein